MWIVLWYDNVDQQWRCTSGMFAEESYAKAHIKKCFRQKRYSKVVTRFVELPDA